MCSVVCRYERVKMSLFFRSLNALERTAITRAYIKALAFGTPSEAGFQQLEERRVGSCSPQPAPLESPGCLQCPTCSPSLGPSSLSPLASKVQLALPTNSC